MSATNGKPGELTAISKAKDLVNHTMWAGNKVFPNNVRNVNSDGTLNNNNAYNGNNGVRPASVEFTATK